MAGTGSWRIAILGTAHNEMRRARRASGWGHRYDYHGCCTLLGKAKRSRRMQLVTMVERRNAAVRTVLHAGWSIGRRHFLAKTELREARGTAKPDRFTRTPLAVAPIVSSAVRRSWFTQSSARRDALLRSWAMTRAKTPGRPPCARRVAEGGTAAHPWE